MKTFIRFTCLFFILCFTVISCQKIGLPQSQDGTPALKNDAAKLASASVLLASAPFVPIDNDSIERPTTLGGATYQSLSYS